MSKEDKIEDKLTSIFYEDTIDLELLRSLGGKFKQKIDTKRKLLNEKVNGCLGKLDLNYASMQQINDKMKQCGDTQKYFRCKLLTHQNSSSFTSDFDIIALAHRSFHNARLLYERIAAVDELCLSYSQQDNIREMHEIVEQLEDLESVILSLQKPLSQTQYVVIRSKLSQVQKITLSFNYKLLDAVSNFEVFSDRDFVASLQSVLEKEATLDQLAINCNEQHKEGKSLALTNNKYLFRKVKNLHGSIMDAIRGNIEHKFNRIMQSGGIVRQLEFVNGYLEIISRLPKSLFDTEGLNVHIHRCLHMCITGAVPNMDAGEILTMLEFVEDYCSNPSISAKVSDDDLLDGNRDVYIDRYVTVATEKLELWISNLTKQEVEKFKAREAEPLLDENGKYISTGFINLLQIVQNQLSPVVFSKVILSAVSKKITECVVGFQRDIVDAMRKDLYYALKLQGKPGFDEYVIMIGNSGLKVTQYIDSLPKCKEINTLGSILYSLSIEAGHILNDLVVHTLNPVSKKLFTREWYDDYNSKTMFITIEDFLNDYREGMIPYFFKNFIYELCRGILSAYLKQIQRKRAIIYDDCGYRVSKDIHDFEKLFETYIESNTVKQALEPFVKFIPILNSSNSQMFEIELKNFYEAYSDIRKETLKAIIKKKADLDDAEKKEFIDITNKIMVHAKSEEKSAKNIFTSIFSKKI